jgi:hypothetical protein
MKKALIYLLSMCYLVSAHADTITLTDGQVLNGKVISQDNGKVIFELAGQQLEFSQDKIQSLHIDKPQEGGDEAVVPTGTRIMVRTLETINSKSSSTGKKFTARLEADLVANGITIAQRGATVYGVITDANQSGRLAGKSSLTFTFTDIMIDNQLHAIKTSAAQAVTEGTGKSTVGRTARLAAIGGLANGSKGAKDGAKVGAGISLLTGGNSVNIPSNTLLEFNLTAPFAKQN